MVIKANRCWPALASIAAGLCIVPIVPLESALAAERNLDARADRAARTSQTGLESTMKNLRKKKQPDTQKNVVIPKKKGSTDQ
jgi:hypothetical protein